MIKRLRRFVLNNQLSSNNEACLLIIGKIKEKIFSGELKRNDRLIETALARENNINKIHVHSALQQLSAEGLLEYKPRRGFFVLGIDESDFLEIVKIREIMELNIMEKFFLTASDQVFEKCIKIIKRKIAFLKSGLLDDADLETIKFFKEINNNISYKHIPRLLKQYQKYLMSIIQKDFVIREDVSITISTTEVLLEALETKDIEKSNNWVKLRHDNLVNSCHTNIDRIPRTIGIEIDREYDFDD